MPRRSSHSRYDDYDDSRKYDDPWMGYSDDFEDPYRHSERTTSRYGDSFSSHAFDNSSSMDQDAYPPRSFEASYSSIRDDPRSFETSSYSIRDDPRSFETSSYSIRGDPSSSSSGRSHRSSSRRPESTSMYGPSSSSSSPFDQYTSSLSRDNDGLPDDYPSSRYNQPRSSRYVSSPYSSRRDSTLHSSSDHDLQSTFTRSILGRDAPSRPSRSSFAYTTPDNSDLYPSSPGRYSFGPTSDPYSNEKYATSRREPSGRSRRHRSSRRYKFE